jgi:type IV secretory pathway protease TraF
MSARRFWIVAVLAGMALAAASFLPRRPMLVWNFTASAPVGLYRALPRPASGPITARGDWVAVEPSPASRTMMVELGILERGRLLVKRVAAVAGDEVCRAGVEVRINGRLAATARTTSSSDVPLPTWSGCRRLGPNDVFLLGQAEGSFDGRYFGITGTDEIVAPLNLLLPAD